MMTIYILVPMGIMTICVMALLVLKGQLIREIEKRDPATLDRFGGPLLPSWGLHRYLEELEAPPGTRFADKLFAYRFWWYLHICVWLVFTIMLVVDALSR